ncbi:potassium voltage-gated channel subfamily C member 1 isoform X1 [Hydra vulgaris]|uniref:potassium voltage-gated channel subfamily C member 1 isoform X1 n=1 Tax=Hydra vulgaris TaxID=6087 RepID=UPI001F5E8768|nr:potassium voltage-gated channel subfamily C member 1 isoform X1 [Hydra vulgaris]
MTKRSNAHDIYLQRKRTNDRVIINVGGVKHECFIETIKAFPDTRLYWIAEAAMQNKDFDYESNEFFFDRHPGCFQNILNYFRTGKLHCPNDVCGPLFQQELEFWGVDELMMEPCCWGNYTQHRDAHKNLKMFDDMVKSTNLKEELNMRKVSCNVNGYENESCWNSTIEMYRPKIWALLDKPFSSKYAQIAAFFSLMVIVASLVTFCMQTVPRFFKYARTFDLLEYIYCGIFTVEFIIRLICCPSYKSFFRSALTYIDFLSTIQFYISFIMKTKDFDFLFVTRLIRIFRLFRFFKQLSGMQVIAQTLVASMNELMLLLMLVTIPMIIFSTLIHYAEKSDSNNDKNYTSIPEYFWWSIVTMTTVGYGDVIPNSFSAKIVGALCACSGLLIVALPVSVIGSNFTLFYSYAQARMKLPLRKNLLNVDKGLVANNQDDSLFSKMLNLSTSNHRRRFAIKPQLQHHSLQGILSARSSLNSVLEDSFLEESQVDTKDVLILDHSD